MKLSFFNKQSVFFSLKWSSLVFLSLVLIVTNSYFYYFHQSGLKEGFKLDRELELKRNSLQLEGLIDQSANHMRQIAEIIPSSYGMQTLFENNDLVSIYALFEENWSALQVKADIETVGVFQLANQQLKMWGDSQQIQTAFEPELMSVLKDRENKERTTAKIFCNKTCRQYIFVPIYANKTQWGVSIVGRSLVQPIINFSQTADIDIGIVSTSDKNVDNMSQSQHLLPEWSAKVLTFSNFPVTSPILRELSKTVNFENLVNDGVVQAVGAKIYELNARALTEESESLVFFLEDVSEPVAVIDQAMRETFWTGILGVLLSELAIILILWPSLFSLKRTLDVIPLLAKSGFEKARKSVRRPKSLSFFRDEIDVLDESIVDLANQLEGLERSVEERNLTLDKKMIELTGQRDFIQSLLDTAQVIIVTQNADGKILLANKQVESVIGYMPDELIGRTFSEKLCGEEDQSLFLYNLNRVSEGAVPMFRNEVSMPRKNGKLCTIEWLHSHIESRDAKGSTVLSVGLDISERKAYEEEIGWLADHDSLTGLYNRRRFNLILKRTLSVATRYEQKVGLLFLDLDNFKQTNDTLGHQTGDMLIKSVSDCLKLILRESDYIARLGGDEFAIILPNISVEDAIDVANKINKHLISLRLPIMDSNHRTSASIGLAMFPEHASCANDLLSNADLAMYQAKSHGRGCWHMFSKEDNSKERMETQLFWRHKIVDALANDKFELHYQPILSISNNDVSHYEALIRIRDEGGELVLPSPFIKVAEKTGLIHDIDHLVIRKAVKELQRQAESGYKMVMAINLSAHSFTDPQLLPLLDRLLNLSKIDPSCIIFEITETAALSDLVGAANLIRKIHDFGCRFALDDFGVGFSSFYYLKELPVDYVKIDGSFIQDLPSNRNDQILVKAMADIAKEFGKKTIAEFVQDDETIEILKSYNIDYAQGYFVGKPEQIAA